MKDIHSKQEFHFEYGNWIRQHRHENGEMIVELPAVRPDIRPFPSQFSPPPFFSALHSLNLNNMFFAVTKYQVSVTTGDEPRAETSAKVFVVLVGKYGDTGKRMLLQPTNHDDVNFRRGNVRTKTRHLT